MPSAAERDHRRFQLADGLLLIAAIAVSCGIMKAVLPLHNGWPLSWTIWKLSSIPAFCGSIVALALRLRRPRPRLRIVFRRAGTTACAATIVAGCLLIAQDAVGYVNGILKRDVLFRLAGPVGHLYYVPDPRTIAIVIASVWLVFMFQGRWRLGTTWPDRLTFAASLVWILLWAAFPILQLWDLLQK